MLIKIYQTKTKVYVAPSTHLHTKVFFRPLFETVHAIQSHIDNNTHMLTG